jgi:hypothetical protein
MTIKAYITGASTCMAEGITATGNAPVLELCRKLIEAGHDPRRPLHAYRGYTLALKVRSIGEGAKYAVGDSKLGTPIFRRWQKDAQGDVGGALVRQNVPALPKAA